MRARARSRHVFALRHEAPVHARLLTAIIGCKIIDKFKRRYAGYAAYFKMKESEHRTRRGRVSVVLFFVKKLLAVLKTLRAK